MENSNAEKTILVADDSAVALALLSRLLKGAGYRVVTASDGIEAAQQAYHLLPDLIILDITMPRMNGYQVCRLLKRDQEVAYIPVIILTGADSRGTEFWSLHTGAEAFLFKSAESAELMATVARLLAQTSSRSGQDTGFLPTSEGRVTPGPEEILSRMCALMDEELYATTIERIELKTILQNLRDGVLTLNIGHEVTVANQALCQMLGRDETELLNQPCGIALGEPAGATTLEAFATALAGGESVERESEIRHRSGQITPVAISAVPLRDFLGSTIGGVCLIHDITRRRELETLYEQMHSLNKVKNDLTHMIVHDLRTPLSSVITGMQTLEIVSDLNEMQQEMVTIAITGGEQLLGMINTLLDVEKMESGEMQLNYALLLPGDLITGAVSQVASLAESNGLTLVSQIEPGLPLLQGDADKMNRILVNLLGNAIKFTPSDGSVTVAAQQAEDQRAVSFSVRDTGEGIPPEAFERIFEKFGQVESRYGGRKSSTGLGLTFCKLAVEAHGGSIQVDSEPGKGSVFSFTIPLTTSTHLSGADQKQNPTVDRAVLPRSEPY